MQQIHNWTYSENEFCVEEVFKNFVINKEYDYEAIITRLFIHFNGIIKRSSIKMKLQNIKWLLIQYQIPNTLMIKPLQNASDDNVHAFFATVKKYNRL